MAIGYFSADSRYYLALSSWVSGSTVYGSISVTKTAGSGYYTSTPIGWSVTIDGTTYSGTWTYDFTASTPQTIGITTQAKVTGSGVRGTSAVVYMHDQGVASASETVTVATTPPAPTAVSVDNATLSTLRFNFSSNGDGGSAITAWQVQYGTDPALVGGTTVNSGSPYTPTGLTPDTSYYFRARGVNAMGNGAWSSIISGSTIASGPPTLAVTPSLSGTSATATLSLGLTAPTLWEVQRRFAGVTTDYSSATSPIVMAGQTPGANNEWRARAKIGSYDSPWSSWQFVLQPSPNTNPGDYFDGSKAAGADVTYSWESTASNSISRSTGVGVLGWAMAGSNGILQRVTGGLYGDYCAKMLMKLDDTAVSQSYPLISGIAVAPNGVYYYSIYVQPSKTQLMGITGTWADGVGSTVGSGFDATPVLCPAGQWTRIMGVATAPALAAEMRLRPSNVAGVGAVIWESGDWVLHDGVMVTLGQHYPFFSGATPDDGQYEYAWLGPADNSISSRTTLEVNAFDALLDPDCAVVPSPPQAPEIVNPCIDEVGSWRRYWAVIPSSEVQQWVAGLPLVTLNTGNEAARQVRVRVYPNPEETAPEDFDGSSSWSSEQIVSYIPPNTSLTLDAVSERAQASVAGGDWLAADHLLYGTGGGPPSWPELVCGQGYLLSFDTPLEAEVGNLQVAVALTGRY